jgi:hypothetical protein
MPGQAETVILNLASLHSWVHTTMPDFREDFKTSSLFPHLVNWLVEESNEGYF